jgi:hypothetical protein
MKKPDTEEFARQVLYHLAALSAEVHENKLLLAQIIGHLTRRPPAEFLNQWKEELEQMTDRLYERSLEAAKIDPPTEDPPPPPALPHFPFPDRGIGPTN